MDYDGINKFVELPIPKKLSKSKFQLENIALDFNPPSKNFIKKVTQPFYDYFTPEFFGLENLSEKKPTLYIANHTIYGVTDGTLYLAEAYLKKNIYMRALADKMHFMIPIWKNIFADLGFANGSRDNCAYLMKKKQHILVFPGGTREACKRKGEEYKLIWKDRTGFARMAIEYGYDIVPIVNVGGDDAFTIQKNPEDVLENTILGKALKWTGLAKGLLKNGENIPPLAYGIGKTIFPKPVKLYFAFGKRISTKAYNKNHENILYQWEVRNKIELAMNKMMVDLLEYRKTDITQFQGLHRKFLLK